MYDFLTLAPRRDHRVMISTTSHPRNDWCGVHSEKFGISGVVDVLVRSVGGSKGAVAVGEVKGGSAGSSGLWQVVAAMQTVASFSKAWPIGMLVPTSMHENVGFAQC